MTPTTPTSGQAGQAANRAAQSDWIDHAARAGLVAFGVVHLIMGWLAVSLALGDREGSTSSTGAFQQLAEQPYGKFLVWLVAIGMFLLAGWQALEAAAGHRDADEDSESSTGPISERLRKRLTSAGKAVVYGVIAVSAVSVALGSSSGGGTDSTTAKLMDLPGGQILVGLVGLGIITVGVVLVVMAYKESYLKKLDAQGKSGKTGTAYRWLGRAGHAAKGVALGFVGALFLYAAFTHEADKSGGLDQALSSVLDEPYGPVLVAVIGLGFAAYGLFCFAEARHLDR